MILPTPEQKKQWKKKGISFLKTQFKGKTSTSDSKPLSTIGQTRAKKNGWRELKRGESVATFYDIPNPLEKDPIFIDIIDYPSYYGALMEFTDHDLILLGPQVRTVAPWPVSYTGWHPDVGHDNPLHIKVQIYVNDVERGRWGIRICAGQS